MADRDKINHKEAGHMLKAQMPIDDKVAEADFMIRNEGNLDETRRAVKALWQTLKEDSKERTKSI